MHWALAILTFAVPLSGLLDRWARGRAVTVFGGLPLPAPFTIPGGSAWGEVHEALASVMLALIAVHVAAALWHQFILRDRALSRMVKG
jgi:cytochrome b561